VLAVLALGALGHVHLSEELAVTIRLLPELLFRQNNATFGFGGSSFRHSQSHFGLPPAGFCVLSALGENP
jgi:hypothetical protein